MPCCLFAANTAVLESSSFTGFSRSHRVPWTCRIYVMSQLRTLSSAGTCTGRFLAVHLPLSPSQPALTAAA
jgi:hypothetical protein